MSNLLTYPQYPMNHVQVLNQNALFGPRSYSDNQKIINDYHYGIDLLGKDMSAEDLVSPADGKCIYLTHNDGSGAKTIVLAHGGLFDDGSVLLTKHAHCSSFNVNVNDIVKRNQVFAKEGKTGNATGNHDHTETWIIPAKVWYDGQTYYRYQFSDRERYAVDPLTIYRVYPHQKKIGWNTALFIDLPAIPTDERKQKVIRLLEEALQLLKE